MFSDTHFHFHYLVERGGAGAGKKILEQMARDNVFFGLDIGTRSDDLVSRYESIRSCLDLIEDAELKSRAESFLHYSAGIWPDVDSIENRFSQMKILRTSIKEFEEKYSQKVCAIGEGGIDHHRNPSGTDGRCESDFGRGMYEGEKELFAMQLELAREMDLPFVMHSRDGFEDTIDVVRNVGWNKGILHCCSYDADKVKEFVELGWYVSFSGSVTYTKKSKADEMNELLRYVPSDRILLETDSPYLSPVPLRGKENNPCNVRHTYEFIANARNSSVESLCSTVDENCIRLFGLQDK